MITQNYLQYEIILLLAKYGERQVLNALASHLQMSSDVLEARLRRAVAQIVFKIEALGLRRLFL